MFTLRRPLATDPVIMKKQFNSFKKQFTLEVVQDWDAGWDILKLLFEQKPVFFKEMQGIFSKALGPKTYSVISYATVGKVTQRVMAIVKKVKRQKSAHELQGNAASQAARAGNQVGAEDGDEKNKKNEYDIKVLRLYWL
jgi:Mrp family chromosome partitioning ATPase